MELPSPTPRTVALERRAGDARLARRSRWILSGVALAALAGGLLAVPVLWIACGLAPLLGVALWMSIRSQPQVDVLTPGRVNGEELLPDAEVVLRGWRVDPVVLEIDGFEESFRTWPREALEEARATAAQVASALERPLVDLVSERPEDDDAVATRWARRLARRRRHAALSLYPEIGTIEPLEPQGLERSVDRMRIAFPEVVLDLTGRQIRVGAGGAWARTCARHRVVDVVVGPFQLPVNASSVPSIRKPVRFGEMFGMQLFLVTLDGVFPLIRSMVPRSVTSQARKREVARLVWIAEAIRDWIPEEPTLAGVPEALSRLRDGSNEANELPER